MSQEWMLELLTDLRNSATKNGMYELSETLDDALLIAARELSATSTCPLVASGDYELYGEFPRGVAEHDVS